MHPLVEAALFNAAIVTALALVVTIVSWSLRRPALTHLLWLLVLVKLLAPPICRVPLIEREWVSRPVASIGSMIELSLADAPTRLPSVIGPSDPSDAQNVAGRARPRSLPTVQTRSPSWYQVWLRSALAGLKSESGSRAVLAGLLGVWGAGTVAWFLVQTLRCLRFQQAMRHGTAAPRDIQEQLQRLAARCGCSKVPLVWSMPGVLSPMLWSTGRSTRLIFPTALLERLDATARETLLAHELAHFQRGDHWVRFLTLFATGLFWWHPVVWWARHAIEAAEEECCDAWVVTRGAAPPRRYAEAILETIDFMAERRWQVPPLGTGMGQLPFLRQRLTWIMRGPRRQDLSRVGRVACCGLALCLPFQPTWLVAQPTTSLPKPIPGHLPFEGGGVLESSVPTAGSPEPTEPLDLPTARAARLPSRTATGELAISSANQRFVVFIGTTRQWVVDRQQERAIDLTPLHIITATFAENGASFVTGSRDGVVRIWDAPEFTEQKAWQGSESPINSVAVSPDTSCVASGDQAGVVRLWQAGSLSVARDLTREAAPVSSLRFSSDGSRLAVATGTAAVPDAGRIVVWRTSDWTEQTSMNWNQPTAAVTFGHDGRSLFSGDWQGRVARWDSETGELLGFVEDQQVAVAAATPDTSRLAEIPVPELPLDLLIGNGNQDEQVKSLWNQLTSRASAFQNPIPSKRRTKSLPTTPSDL